jgi:hypothetical protein
MGVHVTEARSQRIAPGMSQKEVEDVLGGPPGDHRRSKDIGWHEATSPVRPDVWRRMFSDEGVGNQTILTKGWVSDEGLVYVDFDPTTGRVKSVRFVPVHHTRPSLWDRVKGIF